MTKYQQLEVNVGNYKHSNKHYFIVLDNSFNNIYHIVVCYIIITINIINVFLLCFTMFYVKPSAQQFKQFKTDSDVTFFNGCNCFSYELQLAIYVSELLAGPNIAL